MKFDSSSSFEFFNQIEFKLDSVTTLLDSITPLIMRLCMVTKKFKGKCKGKKIGKKVEEKKKS